MANLAFFPYPSTTKGFSKRTELFGEETTSEADPKSGSTASLSDALVQQLTAGKRRIDVQPLDNPYFVYPRGTTSGRDRPPAAAARSRYSCAMMRNT
jgi:hypothetical protein